jgi:hypothetical protein
MVWGRQPATVIQIAQSTINQKGWECGFTGFPTLAMVVPDSVYDRDDSAFSCDVFASADMAHFKYFENSLSPLLPNCIYYREGWQWV